VETDALDIIEKLGGAFNAKIAVTNLDDFLQSFLVHGFVDKAHAFGQNFVEQNSANTSFGQAFVAPIIAQTDFDSRFQCDYF
jgi:hypothetical protein